MSKQIEELSDRILGYYNDDVLAFSQSLVQEILDMIYHNTLEWEGSDDLIQRISSIYGLSEENSFLEKMEPLNSEEDEWNDLAEREWLELDDQYSEDRD